MFECLCIHVCSLQQSKDRLACNSLLITVILQQLGSASIVIALLFWKTQGGKNHMTEKRVEEETAVCRQNELSFLWRCPLGYQCSHEGILLIIDFTPPHTHSHILTLPFFLLSNTNSLSIYVFTFTHADEHTHTHTRTHTHAHTHMHARTHRVKPTQLFFYFAQLHFASLPLLIHTCMYNLLIPTHSVTAHNVITQTLKAEF